LNEILGYQDTIADVFKILFGAEGKEMLDLERFDVRYYEAVDLFRVHMHHDMSRYFSRTLAYYYRLNTNAQPSAQTRVVTEMTLRQPTQVCVGLKRVICFMLQI